MSLRGSTVNLVESVDSAMDCLRWLGEIKGDRLAFDTESTGLSPETDRVRLVQVGDQRNSWAIPFERWGGVFEDIVKRWDGFYIGHNTPFDYAMLSADGIKLPVSRLHDTRLMGHVLEPDQSTALKNQASRHVDSKAAKLQSALDDYMTDNGWTWATIPIVSDGPGAIYWQYGGLDTILTSQLDDHHYPLVQATAPKAYETELAVVWVLNKMMRKGVKVDREYTADQMRKLEAFIADCRKWCLENYNFGPGSDGRIAKQLIDEGYEYALTERTKTGGYSVKAEILEKITHPLVSTVLRHRKATKINSTFLRRFMEFSERDGRIHPSINSVGGSGKTAGESGGGMGVRTGRMSMNSPNLQQLSKESGKNPFSKVVRNCIVAEEGHELVTIDFDQIEMRLLASMSGDAGMIDAFLAPGDFFTTLTQTMHNDQSITKDDPRRNTTKTLSYGKIYGAGLGTFSRSAGLERSEARSAYQLFDRMFPGAHTMAKRLDELVAQTTEAEGVGYVCSPLTGRRFQVDLERPYTIMNKLIQGTAAEVLKIKLVEADNAGLGDYMLLPVHDELISEVPIPEIPDFCQTLSEVMNDTTMFTVPLTAGMAKGPRWGEKRDIDG